MKEKETKTVLAVGGRTRLKSGVWLCEVRAATSGGIQGRSRLIGEAKDTKGCLAQFFRALAKGVA